MSEWTLWFLLVLSRKSPGGRSGSDSSYMAILGKSFLAAEWLRRQRIGGVHHGRCQRGPGRARHGGCAVGGAAPAAATALPDGSPEHCHGIDGEVSIQGDPGGSAPVERESRDFPKRICGEVRIGLCQNPKNCGQRCFLRSLGASFVLQCAGWTGHRPTLSRPIRCRLCSDLVATKFAATPMASAPSTPPCHEAFEGEPPDFAEASQGIGMLRWSRGPRAVTWCLGERLFTVVADCLVSIYRDWLCWGMAFKMIKYFVVCVTSTPTSTATFGAFLDITKNQFPSSKKIHLVLSGRSLVLLCSGGDPRGVSTSAARAACDQRGRRAGRHALGAAAPRGALGDVHDLDDVDVVAGDGRAGGGAGRGGAWGDELLGCPGRHTQRISTYVNVSQPFGKSES